jgi:hypothetical protein
MILCTCCDECRGHSLDACDCTANYCRVQWQAHCVCAEPESDRYVVSGEHRTRGED